MPIINHADVPLFSLPGLKHQTLASHKDGLTGLEMWQQTIAPGVATPVHRHACEEVIVVLRGPGRITIDGREAAFDSPSTLVVPPDAVHQLINSGAEEMLLIAALGSTPAMVTTADGQFIPLPWQETD